MCFAPQRRALFRHRNFQKWYEPLVFFNILTSKCASRHNGVHFFDISTSKSGPRMVLCTFSLRHVLRATTACTFSTSQLPKVVRTWCALYIFTSKCASRHNGVHFFYISTAKSGPHLVCFVHFDLEMCFAPPTACNFSSLIWPAGSAPAALASLLFDPPEPQIIGKTQCFATFLPFRASPSSFFLLFFLLIFLFSVPLPCSAFHLVHIVGSLTSKLPSIILFRDNISIKRFQFIGPI